MDDTAEKKKKGENNECIQVMVRCRPLNRREKEENCAVIVDIDSNIRQLSIKNPEGTANDVPKSFTYDGVFDESTQQKYFYEEACFPLIESVLEGFNATIFAYGQTGSGKSWTMQGDATSQELRGVMPNAFSHIFDYIKSIKDVQFLLRCSYLEIYNEEIRDLLSNNHSKQNPTKYDIRDDPTKGVYVSNLTHVVVDTEEQMMKQLEKGLAIRTVAETLMNDNSSRSHSIFTVIIEMSTKDGTGKDHVKVGKLNLVDLAGSERQKKTGAVGKVLKEGAKINLSLLTLGCVISALADGKSKHVQYRDSKLTRLLQDSLGGNTKTCMVAAISPAESNYDETLSTLRYANNAKNIKNKPRVNEDPKDTMIREFKEEIMRLKLMLMNNQPGTLPSMGIMSDMLSSVGGGNHIVRAGSNNDNDNDDHEPGESDELKSKSLSDQREQVLEQLKAKESEIEQERRLREELNLRLAELQNMFVGKSEGDVSPQEDHVTLSPEEIDARNQIEMERLEAEKKYKERKQRNRKRREQLEKEDLAYVLEEKKAVEDELDELRMTLAASEKNNYDEIVEKKVNKVKRKMDKKLKDAQMELDGLKDDFEYQREQLLDALREEERNSIIYLSICKSLLSEKDLAKIIDRTRIDDDGELIIPHIKQKSIDVSRPSSSSSSSSSTTKSSSKNNILSKSVQLPDVSSSSLSSSSSSYNNNMMDNNKSLSLSQPISSYQDTSLPPVGGNKTCRDSPNKQGIAAAHNNANGRGQSRGNDINSTSPMAKKDHNKKKAKKSKTDNDESINSPLPLPSDEAGGGEFAGPLSDWGFALHDDNQPSSASSSASKVMPYKASHSSVSTASATDQEYSDDDFEVDDDNTSSSSSSSSNHGKKKKKVKNNNCHDDIDNNNDGQKLVPITNNNRKSSLTAASKSSSSSNQSYSLPAI